MTDSSAKDTAGHPRVSSQSERGWRFFTWAGVVDQIGDTYQPQGETEVGPDAPFSRLVCNIEDQLAARLSKAGLAPMEDLDVCFHQEKLSSTDRQPIRADEQTAPGVSWTAGSVTINVDDRIQMVLWIDAEHLREEPDHFVQTVCHEYCHALFVRACLMVDGQLDFSDASVKRANDVFQGDILADEALANAFAMLHHRRITLYHKEQLSYDQLLESKDEYADAYSLSRVLCKLVAELDNDKDNFIYQAIKLLAADRDKQSSIFDYLRQAIENDPVINPAGLSFRQLYTCSTPSESKTSAGLLSTRPA